MICFDGNSNKLSNFYRFNSSKVCKNRAKKLANGYEFVKNNKIASFTTKITVNLRRNKTHKSRETLAKGKQ